MQTNLLYFTETDGKGKYLVLQDLPQFLDVDLEPKGPFYAGEKIPKDVISERMAELLKRRGLIKEI